MGKDDIISIFNGEGFHTWQIKLRGYLMKKNLWGVVKAPIETQEAEGTQTRASTSTTNTQALTKDEQALGIIITALNDNYVHFIDECTSAHNAWITLEKNFGTRTKKSKVSLKKQLYKLKLEANEDVASLVNRLKSLITQLTYIQCKVEEDDKVAALLSALPSSFDNLVTIIEEKEPAPALQDVVNSLQEEEKKHKKEPTVKGEAYFVSNTKTCFTCNKAGHLSKDCYHNNPCNHCNKTGHPSERCYYKDGNMKKFNNNKKESSSSGNNNTRRNKGKINLVEDDTNEEDSSDDIL